MLVPTHKMLRQLQRIDVTPKIVKGKGKEREKERGKERKIERRTE